MRTAFLALAVLMAAPLAPAIAQDDRTLADIRQELTVLNVEIQRLKRELSTTGSPAVQIGSSGSVLDRVASIEAALQALTDRTERLEFRIESIVRDGTNRIGDLEFRLVELEGGDVSQLGETSTLGGPAPQTGQVAAAQVGGNGQGGQQAELAIGERSDYEAALTALDEGQYRSSADALTRFIDAYPGSPLAPEAHLARGKALAGLGDTREAARAYLAGFSADPTGPVAPDALVRLGVALGDLGQVEQACLTLAEVPVRFPMASAVSEATAAQEKLGCP